MLLLLLAILILLAPTIACLPASRHWLLATFAPEIAPHVAIGSAQIGWLSPLHIEHLTVTDLENRPAIEVEQIASQHRLLGLVRGLRQITVTKPNVHVVVESDGSTNLGTLAQLLDRASDDNQLDNESHDGPTAPIDIALRDGTLQIWQGDDTALHVTDVMGDLTITGNDWSTWSGSLRAMAHGLENGDETGAFQVSLNPAATPSGAEPDRLTDAQGGPDHALTSARRGGQATLSLSQFPWQWRIDPSHPPLAGKLSGNCHVALGVELDLATFRARLACENLRGGGEFATLPPHRIDLDTAGELDTTSVTFHQLAIDSDLITLRSREVGLPWQAFESATTFVAALNQPEFRVQGTMATDKLIAFAPIASALPDCHLEGGGVTFAIEPANSDVASHSSNTWSRWHGKLEVAPGNVSHQGEPFSWTAPMRLNVDFGTDGQAITIGRLICETPFVTAEGANDGNDQFHFTSRGDLSLLIAHLGPFWPNRPERLAGEFEIEADIRQATKTPTGDWQATFGGQIRNFVYSPDGIATWHEPVFGARGNVRGTGWTTPDADLIAGRMHVTFDQRDQLSLELTERSETTSGSWPTDFDLQGDAHRWQLRALPFYVAPVDLAGTVRLQGRAIVRTDDVTITASELVWHQCEARSPTWSWREPIVQTHFQGVIRPANASVEWTDVALTSTALALRAQPGNVSWRDGQITASAQVAFQGDVPRLATWTGWQNPWIPTWCNKIEGSVGVDSSQGNPSWLARIESGNRANSDRDAGGSGGNSGVTTRLDDAHRWRANFVAEGIYDNAAGRMRVDNIRLQSPDLSIAAKTTLVTTADRAVPTMLRVSGSSRYRLAQLVPSAWTAPYGITELRGDQEHPFAVEVPWPSESADRSNGVVKPISTSSSLPPHSESSHLDTIRGNATLGWDSVRILDLPVGPTTLQARLDRGIVHVDPVRTTVGAGDLELQPWVDLRQRGGLGLHPSRLTRVHLTPETCRGWMRFVAPLLSEVADAEGQFSVGVDRAAIPWHDPHLATAQGQLILHEGVVGPGRLTSELLRVVTSVGQITGKSIGSLDREQWLRLPEQQVGWQVDGGRVYHEGLTVTIGDVTLHSSGWVDLNENMELVAEVPVEAAWVERIPWLASLAGKSIRLPVQGTLRQPRVDARGLAQMSRSALEETARDAVRGEVERQLLRLFNGS